MLGTTLFAPAMDHDYIIDGIGVYRMAFCNCEKLVMAPFVAGYYPLMLMGYPPVGPLASIIERQLRPYAESADIIHNVRIGREGLSYASYKAAQRCNIPFVLTPVHHPRWVGRKYRAFNKLYTLADAVMALTEAEKKILVQLGTAEERVHVIGHGPVLAPQAHPERFLQDHGIDGSMVLFLGQHYPYKGYRELLAAAESVWQKKPETHFVFIGPAVGQSESIFLEITDRRVLRLGSVGLQEKTDALSACSLLCVPSTQESFGGIYAEAWCFTKPVMGCPIPAVSEVIDDNKNGFLVEQDPAAIADKIIQLLENPIAARQMGEAGKTKVEETYTWQRIAGRAERVYNKLTNIT